MSEVKRLLDEATPRPWGVTHFSGGMSFAGPPRLYAGTDPEYGEPRSVGTEADYALIVYAVNRLADLEALREVTEHLVVAQSAYLRQFHSGRAEAILRRLRESEPEQERLALVADYDQLMAERRRLIEEGAAPDALVMPEYPREAS